MASPMQVREQRFLTWTDWEGYLSLRQALTVRITYDQGGPELMSPSPEHEQANSAGPGNRFFSRRKPDMSRPEARSGFPPVE